MQTSKLNNRGQNKKDQGVTLRDIAMEQMVCTARLSKRTLDENLMEKICNPDNLNQAYKRVKDNKGAAGIDGMEINELYGWIKQHKGLLISSLLSGSYNPKPVRKVIIPKPDGGERMLGIPTLIDRLVQQAILQILTPIIDPVFSNHSYGFRKGRGPHLALKSAQKYIAEGYNYVVDIDLEKFFDRVNHDMIMSRLAKYIGDKRVLKIIRKFLQSGIMDGEVFIPRHEGTPQGGPLSPLLANLLLHDLDLELEKRSHKFCRYADDCNIYVRSKLAAQRVLSSISNFIKSKLRLTVNTAKSAASGVSKRSFLGYTIKRNSSFRAADKGIIQLKNKLRILTRRSKGRSITDIIARLNLLIRGWTAYFKLDTRNTLYQNLDSWLKRRLRCYKLKQKKRPHTIAKWLIQLGIDKYEASCLAYSSKGWWRLSKTKALHLALDNDWFSKLGLLSFHKEIIRLNRLTKTAVCDNACTVV